MPYHFYLTHHNQYLESLINQLDQYVQNSSFVLYNDQLILQKEILEEKNAAFMTQGVEVLVEARHKGRWRGRTPQNRLVFFDDERDLVGALVTVKVTHCGPYSLTGECVEVLDTKGNK